MLKQLWSWMMYGEMRELGPSVLLGLALLLTLSYTLLKPWVNKNLMTHEIIRVKLIDLDSDLRLIASLPTQDAPPEPNQSLFELGQDFHLAVKRSQDLWYFAGPTENLLLFLHRALTQAYPIQEFTLMKSSYNTLLAIRL